MKRRGALYVMHIPSMPVTLQDYIFHLESKLAEQEVQTDQMYRMQTALLQFRRLVQLQKDEIESLRGIVRELADGDSFEVGDRSEDERDNENM